MTWWYISNTMGRRSFIVGPERGQKMSSSSLQSQSCMAFMQKRSLLDRWSAKFTQLSSGNREVLHQNSPLLYALGVRCGFRIDSVDALLNGPVHIFVFSFSDVRHLGCLASLLLAKLHSLHTQLLCWLHCFCIGTTLKQRMKSQGS